MNLPKRILVVGSGGREHALVRACLASPGIEAVMAAPGNGGIAAEVPVHPVAADRIDELVALARREQIDFVLVGPEVPLSLGLVDALESAGIPAYGPRADGARLEASKVFTKTLLLKYGIPTAAAATFSQVEPALNYLRTKAPPVVVKADGLASGKGVVVAQSLGEAEEAVRSMIEGGVFGRSGSQVLIEDCLIGEEASIHVVVSGRDFVVLPTSQDHKRVGEGDSGPNTGGMGAYSPAAVVNDDLLDQITRQIVRPSVDAIAAEGIDFRGTLYIGLMLTDSGPQVLEFNTRFGDPETQVLLPRLRTDPLRLFWACAQGRLAEVPLEIAPEAALCVVIAARGYPGEFSKGEPIRLPAVENRLEMIFHAGTLLRDGSLVSNGGRVLGVIAVAPDLKEAADRAYAICERIDFASKYFRRDIGARQLKRSP